MTLSIRRLVFSFALCGIFAGITPAANLTQLIPPQDLNNGDKFRLIFLTGFVVDFNTTDIADYDDFVTDQAALDQTVDPLLLPSNISLITQGQLLSILQASGVTWQAVVSTPTVDARDHIGAFNVPVYRMDGLRVANNSLDLWDGTLINSVRYDQPGHEHNYPIWTGSNADGTKSANPLGTATPTRGESDSGGTTWMTQSTTAAFSHIYGISSEITVVPEPGSLMLTGLGLAGLLFAARTARRNS